MAVFTTLLDAKRGPKEMPRLLKLLYKQHLHLKIERPGRQRALDNPDGGGGEDYTELGCTWMPATEPGTTSPSPSKRVGGWTHVQQQQCPGASAVSPTETHKAQHQEPQAANPPAPGRPALLARPRREGHTSCPLETRSGEKLPNGGSAHPPGQVLGRGKAAIKRLVS